MTDTQTPKCPKCGRENDLTARICAVPSCSYLLKSEIECLRSIDKSVATVKRVLIFWLILTIMVIIFGIMNAIVIRPGGSGW